MIYKTLNIKQPFNYYCKDLRECIRNGRALKRAEFVFTDEEVNKAIKELRVKISKDMR